MITTALALMLPLVATTTTPQLPGWTYYDLNKLGWANSIAYSTWNGQTVGVRDYYIFNYFGPVGRATIWSGTSSSIDVTPAAASAAVLRRTNGTYQVGAAVLDQLMTASIWSGSGGSWTMLDNMTQNTYASGSYGSRAVGERLIGNEPFALIWPGINWQESLHPSGWENSRATADGGTYQVGMASHSAYPDVHACSWTGSASSFVDRHPSDYNASGIFDIHGTSAVGFAVGPAGYEAYLWTFTTRGFSGSIHPGVYAQSIAYDIHNKVIVGRAYPFGPGYRAFLWNRNTGAQVDLSNVFPPGTYGNSTAWGVYVYAGGRIDVCGSAVSLATGQNHAILWRYEES